MAFSPKNHPFAVEAFFQSSLVLTYALPKATVQDLIPECLVPDTFEDRWAFGAVALVQTRGLRPKGFPGWMGHDFGLTGYRLFVRYTNARGKRLRGLFILKSQTDKRGLELLGNLFTHYRYDTTDLSFCRTGSTLSVHSRGAALDVEVGVEGPGAVLPAGSPFRNWGEARRFAGPLPFTFSYDAHRREVLVVEGVRQHWEPAPVAVRKSKVGFLENGPLGVATLASAFLVENVPYYWKKGAVEKWRG